MADLRSDQAPNAETDENARTEPAPARTTRRWANVLGLIALVVILVFAAWLLVAGGHGPVRHAPPGGVPEWPSIGALGGRS
jgi:ferric-dicitrate binding protein FerR (iron transport regulator)